MTENGFDKVLKSVSDAYFDGNPKGQKKWDESATALAEVFGCRTDQLKIKTARETPQMNLMNRIHETTARAEVRYPVVVCSNKFDCDDPETIKEIKSHLRIPGREAVLLLSQDSMPNDSLIVPRRLVALEYSPVVEVVRSRWPGIQIDLVVDNRSIRKALHDVASEQQKFGQGPGVFDPVRRLGHLKSAAQNLDIRISQLDLPHNLKVSARAGNGNSALIPYIRVFDPAKSKNASTGFYVCLFVKGDGDRLYLSVQQPSTNGYVGGFGQFDRGVLNQDSAEKLATLRSVPALAADLAALKVDRGLDLRDGNGNVGVKSKNYDVSDICSIGYDMTKLPSDSDLVDQVSVLLKAADYLNQTYPHESDGGFVPQNLVADMLNWPASRVNEMLDSLMDVSPQIVLAGPPGTGKTFAARLIASELLGVPGNIQDPRISLVQFHPTFGYEDFVEGLRPVAEGGAVVFETVPGPIVRLTREIRKDGGPRVLIIDEINRANIPRVFGELMYLLEYRDHSIDLMLERGFSLPPDLYIIATMNTADKSTRVMDVALRRRFDFFTLNPDVLILKSHYEENGMNHMGDELFAGFEALNKRLAEDLDRHRLIGHSYFMTDNFDIATLHARWNRQISPLLDEYFFERQIQANGYRIEEFWPSAAS